MLTTGYDNLPGWSPDGRRIVFTRKVDAVNFDIFTIRPDGTTLRRLTTHGANDGHAVWTDTGRIAWSSGRYGFRDEAALYDDTSSRPARFSSWTRTAATSGWSPTVGGKIRCRSTFRRSSCPAPASKLAVAFAGGVPALTQITL